LYLLKMCALEGKDLLFREEALNPFLAKSEKGESFCYWGGRSLPNGSGKGGLSKREGGGKVGFLRGKKKGKKGPLQKKRGAVFLGGKRETLKRGLSLGKEKGGGSF